MIMLSIITNITSRGNSSSNSSRSSSHTVRGAFGVVVDIVGDSCCDGLRRATASILISYFQVLNYCDYAFPQVAELHPVATAIISVNLLFYSCGFKFPHNRSMNFHRHLSLRIHFRPLRQDFFFVRRQRIQYHRRSSLTLLFGYFFSFDYFLFELLPLAQIQNWSKFRTRKL